MGVEISDGVGSFAVMKRALLLIGLLAALVVAACGSDDDNRENGGGGNAPETCADCVGTNTGPANMPDPAVSCEPSGEQFACTCTTQSGATATVFLSAAGCQ